MRGTVVKRGKTWSIVYDEGTDPVTRKRRQRWNGGFPTRKTPTRRSARRCTSSTRART